jgi:hypothetical protein
MPIADREGWSISKTVVRYTQVMGELPVSGSDVRIVTARDKQVEPFSVRRTSRARRAAEMASERESSESAEEMDAVSMEATPQTITGTVYAWRTPDWWADTRFISEPDECLTEPEEYEQQEVRVELWNTAGTTLIDTEYTNASGDYTLVCPTPGNYLVRATLGGLNWDLVHFSDQTNGCATSSPEPVYQEEASVASNSTGVDFTFGSESGSAQEIADTNVHEALRICMSYWRGIVPGNSPLNDYFLAWTDWADHAMAQFIRQGSAFGSGTWDCVDSVMFGDGASGYTVHFGSATIAAHEFGHFVSNRLRIVLPVPYGGTGGVEFPAFSEGYSDATVAVLLPDASGSVPPTVIGPSTNGDACGIEECAAGTHLRQPLVCDPLYPGCFNTPSSVPESWYNNGMLLAALWMDTREAMGFSDTRTLFSTWSMIATAPGIEIDGCQPCYHPNGPPCSECLPCVPDEGAGANTLYEVLIADDDDENLENGTPNDEALCGIYAARNIYLEIDVEICEEHSGSKICMPDCDCSGIVNLFDVLTFQNWFMVGSAASELNGDGVVDVHDYVIFWQLFASAWVKE